MLITEACVFIVLICA